MKKIFFIGHDPAFASLSADSSSSATDISSLQADVIENYKAPVCRLKDLSVPQGNFYYLNDTALVFDDATDRLTGEFLGHASLGEMYELDVDGAGTLYLLNVVETLNPIDKNASEWVPGSWQKTIAMNKLIFHPKRVSGMSSLFKIPELDFKPILCFSGFTFDGFPQEHDFYKFYHEHGLTGLSFTEIWSGE